MEPKDQIVRLNLLDFEKFHQGIKEPEHLGSLFYSLSKSKITTLPQINERLSDQTSALKGDQDMTKDWTCNFQLSALHAHFADKGLCRLTFCKDLIIDNQDFCIFYRKKVGI